MFWAVSYAVRFQLSALQPEKIINIASKQNARIAVLKLPVLINTYPLIPSFTFISDQTAYSFPFGSLK